MIRAGRSRITAAVVCAVWAGAVLSGSAQAALLDFSSDLTALGAYRSYVSSLVAGAASGRGIDAQYITSIDSNCGNVLAPLRNRTVDQAVLEQFGEEIGGDLAIEFHSEAGRAFTRLAAALGRLKWSTRAASHVVGGLIASVQTSLALSPSRLCADARALAAHPASEPGGTSRFLDAYLPATARAKQRLVSFLKLLGQFQTSKEQRLIGEINRLVARFDASSAAAVQSGSKQLVADLGLAPGS